MKEEEWRTVAFKNAVFQGEMGYTDTKLVILCELNFVLGPELADCMIAIHQQKISLQEAAENFGTAFMSAMRSRNWVLR